MVLTKAPPVAQESVPATFFARAAMHPRKVALRRKRLGLWESITWEQYTEQARLVAHALMALGIEPGERVGLVGENRPEWLFADMGIQSVGAWTTGIYTTSSPEQVHYILEHAECRLFFVEGEEHSIRRWRCGAGCRSSSTSSFWIPRACAPSKMRRS